MSLIRENFETFLTFEDLAINPFEPYVSELDNFKNSVAEDVFPVGEMAQFKKNLQNTIVSYGTDTPSSLVPLKNNLKNITPKELSGALFFGGVSTEFFSVDTFEYSLENLVKISTIISAFGALVQGGCEILRIALKTIKNLTDVSSEDLDISSAIESFVIGIVRDVESLITSTVESVAQMAKNIISEVESQIQNLKNLLDSLSEVSLNDVQDFLKNSADLFVKAIENAVNNLISGIETTLSSIVNITLHCAGVSQGNMKEIEETLQSNVNDMNSSEMSDVEMSKIRQDLRNSITRNKEYYNDTNVAYKKLQTAAFIQKFKQNNPDATPSEIENATKKMIAGANKENDDKLTAKMEIEKEKVNRVPAMAKEVVKKSKDNESTSALAGRKVPSKEELKIKAASYLENTKLYDESYFGGRFAKEISKAINKLQPKVRSRFADGMRDLTMDKDLIAANIEFSITSSFRSYEKQKQLYKIYSGKSPVAYPGNSWHNYGVAVDIIGYVDGVAKGKKSGWYKTLPRQFLQKYRLVNPFANDYIHFQPEELELSPRNLKGVLIAYDDTINDSALNSLLT